MVFLYPFGCLNYKTIAMENLNSKIYLVVCVDKDQKQFDNKVYIPRLKEQAGMPIYNTQLVLTGQKENLSNLFNDLCAKLPDNSNVVIVPGYFHLDKNWLLNLYEAYMSIHKNMRGIVGIRHQELKVAEDKKSIEDIVFLGKGLADNNIIPKMGLIERSVIIFNTSLLTKTNGFWDFANSKSNEIEYFIPILSRLSNFNNCINFYTGFSFLLEKFYRADKKVLNKIMSNEILTQKLTRIPRHKQHEIVTKLASFTGSVNYNLPNVKTKIRLDRVFTYSLTAEYIISGMMHEDCFEQLHIFCSKNNFTSKVYFDECSNCLRLLIHSK